MAEVKWGFVLKICVVALIIVPCLGFTYFVSEIQRINGTANSNSLVVGEAAKSASLPDFINISINPTRCFNGMKRSEVLALRTQMVNQHPELAGKNYQPFGSIFGAIEDGRPWWGIPGQFYYGPGQDSTTGDSEESRFVLNPYLLVSPDLSGMSIWGGKHWNESADQKMQNKDYTLPYYCLPDKLTYFPNKARAEVSYNVSQYINSLTPWFKESVTLPDDGAFSFENYNARDLGFTHYFVDAANSKNIRSQMAQPLPLRQFLHRGGSCRFPGGCNNGSPAPATNENFLLNGLPANVSIMLWRSPPKDMANPDMVFNIDLK